MYIGVDRAWEEEQKNLEEQWRLDEEKMIRGREADDNRSNLIPFIYLGSFFALVFNIIMVVT
jgi:hypothetical protein